MSRSNGDDGGFISPVCCDDSQENLAYLFPMFNYLRSHRQSTANCALRTLSNFIEHLFYLVFNVGYLTRYRL